MHYWSTVGYLLSLPNNYMSFTCRDVYPVTPLASTWKRAFLFMEYTESCVHFIWSIHRKHQLFYPCVPKHWNVTGKSRSCVTHPLKAQTPYHAQAVSRWNRGFLKFWNCKLTISVHAGAISHITEFLLNIPPKSTWVCPWSAEFGWLSPANDRSCPVEPKSKLLT